MLKRFLIITIHCFSASLFFSQESNTSYPQKIEEVYNMIDHMYVDDVQKDEICDAAIVAMLEQLDPHSSYIPKDEVESANEKINGSFVGIGIRFQIVDDTLLVVNPIPGGPSEKLGIRAGDKIIKIDDEIVAGVGLKNAGVRERLLGEKGSKVNVTIKRKRSFESLSFTITRDNIALNSVTSSYMVDSETGYLKLTSFSKTTREEVTQCLKDLKSKGMKNLIFDLQGNGGGLLYAAKYVADEFLDEDKLIVYSEGRSQPKSVLSADTKGEFEKGKLILLIDEGSASASEILAGAIQDWDRGVVVGRRSFGKGLVQRPMELNDGSQIRLTIARYYTPSGRFIQKPYDDKAEYDNDYLNRYLSGELMNADSIKFPDSLKYKTLNHKRTVYGGGGIMPDLFVPLDTSEYSTYYKKLSQSGIFNDFAIRYVEDHRAELQSVYNSLEDFKKNFGNDNQFINDFIVYANETDTTLSFSEADFSISNELIHIRLKALIASNLWDYSAFYEIFNAKDEIFMAAYNILLRDKYESLLLSEK